MKSFWCTEFMYQVHPWLRNPAYFDILSIDREEVLSSIQIQCPHQCWREGDADASSSLILVSRSIYPFPYVHATAHSAMVSIPKLREFSLQQFAVEDDELLFQRNPPKGHPSDQLLCNLHHFPDDVRIGDCIYLSIWGWIWNKEYTRPRLKWS